MALRKIAVRRLTAIMKTRCARHRGLSRHLCLTPDPPPLDTDYAEKTESLWAHGGYRMLRVIRVFRVIRVAHCRRDP